MHVDSRKNVRQRLYQHVWFNSSNVAMSVMQCCCHRHMTSRLVLAERDQWSSVCTLHAQQAGTTAHILVSYATTKFSLSQPCYNTAKEQNQQPPRHDMNICGNTLLGASWCRTQRRNWRATLTQLPGTITPLLTSKHTHTHTHTHSYHDSTKYWQ